MTDDHREIEQTASTWLARRDAGGWSGRQQAALDAWLAESVAHRVAFLRLETAWVETARLRAFATSGTGDSIPARGEWAHSPYFATQVRGHSPAPEATASCLSQCFSGRSVRRGSSDRHGPPGGGVAARDSVALSGDAGGSSDRSRRRGTAS